MRNKFVILSVLFACLAGGCLTPVSPDGEIPEPEVSDVDKAVERARRLYLPALGEQFKQAADKLDSGELKTDRDAHDFLAERNKLSRDAAFSELNELMNDGTWEPEKAAELYREIAKAMSK